MKYLFENHDVICKEEIFTGNDNLDFITFKSYKKYGSDIRKVLSEQIPPRVTDDFTTREIIFSYTLN